MEEGNFRFRTQDEVVGLYSHEIRPRRAPRLRICTCTLTIGSLRLLLMILSRQTKQRTLFLWTLLLSMALLCAQDLKLHIHILGNDHNLLLSHTTPDTTTEHSHLSKAHLTTDTSHGEHHNETPTELDLKPYSLLKKVASNLPTLAFLASVFILFFPVFYRQAFNRRRDKDILPLWQPHFSPPLRAPPLSP